MTDRDILIAANMAGVITADKIHKRLNREDDISHLDVTARFSLNSKEIDSLSKTTASVGFKRELELINTEGINIITLEDEAYPQLLKKIYDPPLVLYVKGDIKREDKLALAVVGSRRASDFGLRLAADISSRLSSAGITIVSGGARGIDTSAHKGALEAGGRTLAVLGSGLLRLYPPENRDLFSEIGRVGALISEFPLHTPPYRYNFPKRNRVIAGLSLATAVVEARKKSGSLITANLALNEGRDVFAFPGRANSLQSQGTNLLIKAGAKLVETAEDIVDEFNPEVKNYINAG